MKKILFVSSILLSSSLFAQFDPSEKSTSQKFDEVMDNLIEIKFSITKG
jgi:hypothetical protein